MDYGQNDRKKLVRNVAILALVALAVAVLPRGGDAVDVMLSAVNALFLVGIAWAGVRLYRSQSFFLDTLAENFRGLLYASVALIVFALVAGPRFNATGGAMSFAWLCMIAAGLGGLYLVWRESRRLVDL